MVMEKMIEKLMEKKKVILPVFLCGMILLVLSWPTGSSEKKESTKSETKIESKESETEEYEALLEERLKTILSKVEGVKGVEVMITLKNSGEKVTLKDSPYSQETTTEKDENGETNKTQISSEETTVLIETDEGTSPYVLKEKEPQVEGVLVLVEGLSDASIKNEISEAVEALFGVASHKIKVMKMKSD
jgi:stage III sporulation protein AG